MRIILLPGLLSVALCLCACSPMNSEFSCNATAGDQCLSIEEVNAMTEADAPLKRISPPPMQQGRAHHFTQNNTQTIWIAPWTDEQGKHHTNDTLFASKETDH